MAHITIVGAGQAGLQLGLGLLKQGFEVTILSDRTAEQIRVGKIMSSQCMFASSLDKERELGIAFWDETCPPVDGMSIAVTGPDGRRALSWEGRLHRSAQSVDQRVKMPRWIAEFQKLGGDFRIENVDIAGLERCRRASDLVLVASGKGDIGKLFARDAAKSPFDKPMRALGLTYVTGMVPRPEYAAVCFNIIPGVGEYFVFPALTTTGPCEIMVFEGILGGPMDCWTGLTSPEQHMDVSLNVLKTLIPWEYERCANVALTDANGILTGRFPPTVRHPVGTLPSGAHVLGVGDAVCLNDPLTGQGANNAAKCAAVYLDSIVSRRGKAYDAAWMQATFDRYWDYARYVVELTNAMLVPPMPHVLKLHGAASQKASIATWFANGFDYPPDLFPAFADAAAADALIGKAA